MNLNAGNPIVGLAIAAYVAVVFWRGNVVELGKQLTKEGGYLEFLVAAYIIYLLMQSKQIGSTVTPLVGVGIIAVLLKVAVSPVVTDTLAQYGAGQIGLFAAFVQIFGTSEASAVIKLPSLSAPLLRAGGPYKE